MKITKETRLKGAQLNTNGVEKLKPINYEKLAKGLFFEAQEQQVRYVGGVIVGLHRSKKEFKAITRNIMIHAVIGGIKTIVELIIGPNDGLDMVSDIAHGFIGINDAYNGMIIGYKIHKGVKKLTQKDLDEVLKVYYAKADAAGMCEDEDLFDEEEL